jgi:sugar (pentulose or hexulose) kinase
VTLFVGLDLGTTGGRCLVVDEEGRRVASAARPWSYRSEGFGMCELDPDVAYTAMAEATRETVSRVDAQDIAAVGITSQRTGVVLVDDEGKELYSGPNADGRAIAEGAELEREHGDLVYRTAGRLPVML